MGIFVLFILFIGVVVFLLSLRKGGEGVDIDIWGSSSHYTSNLSYPEAYVREKAAKKRSDLLAAQVSEQKNRLEMHYLPERAAEVREAEVKKHDLFLRTHEVNMRVADQAFEHNVDTPVYLEVKKHQLLSEQERINEQNRAIDEIRMTIIAKWLRDHQKLAEIQGLIDRVLIEIAELTNGSLGGVPIDPLVIPRMIASREESIAAWEGNKRGIQERLLQNDDRKALEGADEEGDYSGDPG